MIIDTSRFIVITRLIQGDTRLIQGESTTPVVTLLLCTNLSLLLRVYAYMFRIVAKRTLTNLKIICTLSTTLYFDFS